LEPIAFTPTGSVGLDFGTTNSAIATVIGSQPILAEFAAAAGTTNTFPSILYFERRKERALTRLVSAAGPKALELYLEAEDKGRLIQSLKAYLADRGFDGTGVFSQHYSLVDMVSLIVRHLLLEARGLTSASQGSHPVPARVVAGRPVHFSNAHNGEDDEFALGRLREAIASCGFTDIVFEYEPVAAAYSYEQTLDRDELILIGDFGGGTSDFSILRVGPTERQRGRAREGIVGTDGVAVAGDAFDRQIIRKLVAPRLGLGSEFFAPPDKFLPIPSWPYERLERWHHLSFLNTAKNLEMLELLRRAALIPERLEAFVHLIKNEMGLRLHESVRRVKFALSANTAAQFEFHCEPVSITKNVTRADFEKWIEPEVSMMAACVDRLLDTTGVAAKDIDHIFLTGGSSFVPAVRNIFVERFGAGKITGGKELTSVATGLSLCAAREWPA
jgi:hypothetical chaperone protein